MRPVERALDALPRRFEHRPRLASFGMGRAGIGPMLHRISHRFARLGEHRRGRGVVEVDAVGHFARLTADCLLKSQPYIGRAAAAHPWPLTLYASTRPICPKSFSQVRRGASKAAS